MEQNDEWENYMSYGEARRKCLRERNCTIISDSLEREELPWNIVDMNRTTGFWTEEELDQRVCLDFHTMQVRPIHYRLRAQLTCYPDSWVVDGSLDGENWTEIHVGSPIDDKHSEFHPTNSVECRFIRITVTGPDPYCGSYPTCFVDFKVFGTRLVFQE
jgi:hypothetical protein